LRDFTKIAFIEYLQLLSLFLLTALSGLAQSAAKKPVEPETKKGT
jgi:hypothetical protein